MIRYNGGTSSATGSTTPSTGVYPRTTGGNSFVAPGYSFAGWFTQTGGGGTQYVVGGMPPTNAFSGTSGQYDVLDLYADWTEDATTTTAPATTQAPTCNSFYLANTSSYSSASLTCSDCGCGGSSVSITGIQGQSYASANNTFCSDQPTGLLNSYINATPGANAFINSVGTCSPGSGLPGSY